MFNLQDELENTATFDSIQEWTIPQGVDVPSASSSQVAQALNGEAHAYNTSGILPSYTD